MSMYNNRHLYANQEPTEHEEAIRAYLDARKQHDEAHARKQGRAKADAALRTAKARLYDMGVDPTKVR